MIDKLFMKTCLRIAKLNYSIAIHLLKYSFSKDNVNNMNCQEFHFYVPEF